MGYLYLVISLVFNVAGQLSVKLSYGFTNRMHSVNAFLSFGLSIYFLTLSVQFLELGIVYAIWSGLSIVSTSILGCLFFNESKNKSKFASISLVIFGVIILHIV